MPSSASRPDGRRLKTEESPGSMRTRRRITSGGGDPRESATESKPPDRGPQGPQSETARVKGCGKSAPRGRQRRRHGKPRREQNRIGATRGAFSAARPCPLAPPLGLVARGVRQRASQRNGRHVGAMSPGHTEPGLQADWRLLRFSFKIAQGGPRSSRTRAVQAGKCKDAAR
jgi:hypothetical protein